MSYRSLTVLLLFFAQCLCLGNAGRVGDRYPVLKSSGKTFYKVEIRQITAQGLILFHSRGISQVPFTELSPDMREKYGYDPEEAAVYLLEREARQAQAQAEAEAQESAQKSAGTPGSVLDRFGTPPRLYERVDLREAFNRLNLQIKDQGRRPSCSVFAVVSALEFENAKVSDVPEKLSEEYLIWATRELLGIPAAVDPAYDPETDGDLGFSLTEVVQALRRYGILRAADMPNTFGKSMAKIDKPDEVMIESARERRKVTATYITGRTNADRINNIIHALNAGIPVVVGLPWPHSATLRNAPILSKQAPQYNHAVTLVGYKCDRSKISDTLFLFKNSWGPDWGINGHGWISYGYMMKHLSSAVLLEVK